MSNITDFVASISKNGLANSNRFLVTISPPAKVSESNSAMTNYARELQMACEKASVPGITLATDDVRYYDMPAKIAKGKSFGDSADFTFRVDRTFKVLQYFQNWMNIIYDPNTGNVGYYDDYKGTVVINLLDRSGLSVFKVTLREAYPISVNAIDLDWSNTGERVTLSVAFAYKMAEYEPDATEMGNRNVTTAPEAVDNTLQPLKNAGAIAESYLKSNLKTTIGGTYVPLTGIFDKLTK